MSRTFCFKPAAAPRAELWDKVGAVGPSVFPWGMSWAPGRDPELPDPGGPGPARRLRPGGHFDTDMPLAQDPGAGITSIRAPDGVTVARVVPKVR